MKFGFARIRTKVTALSFGIAGALAVGLPAEALTFAGSSVNFKIDNFSKLPESVLVSTLTDTVTVSPNGTVSADSEAASSFEAEVLEETIATNEVLSQAFGVGNLYTGFATGQAAVFGDFILDTDETFSFSFEGALSLLAFVQNPATESAFASGKIGLSILVAALDSEEFTEVASLFLTAALLSPGGLELLDVSQSGEGFSLNEFDVSASDNALGVTLAGSFARSFSTPVRVAVLEVKQADVAVEAVPSPSLVLGLLALLGKGLAQRRTQQLAEERVLKDS